MGQEQCVDCLGEGVVMIGEHPDENGYHCQSFTKCRRCAEERMIADANN